MVPYFDRNLDQLVWGDFQNSPGNYQVIIK